MAMHGVEHMKLLKLAYIAVAFSLTGCSFHKFWMPWGQYFLSLWKYLTINIERGLNISNGGKPGVAFGGSFVNYAALALLYEAYV